VTWANGATGTTGDVSATNSLVGNIAQDRIGDGGITALPRGNYAVTSIHWTNGALGKTGAITFGLGSSGGTVGPITVGNSVLGTEPGQGFYFSVAYDDVNGQMVVGRPLSNIVTLFRVQIFDACVQDDANPNTSVAFNTQTGDYLFCAGGAQYRGMGTITRRGSMITLQHTANDRRLTVTLDTAVNRATGSFQKIGSGVFSLTDRDTRNDTCSCAAP